jgi:hypothetical protein
MLDQSKRERAAYLSPSNGEDHGCTAFSLQAKTNPNRP